jgi:hypothetical protein
MARRSAVREISQFSCGLALANFAREFDKPSVEVIAGSTAAIFDFDLVIWAKEELLFPLVGPFTNVETLHGDDMPSRGAAPVLRSPFRNLVSGRLWYWASVSHRSSASSPSPWKISGRRRHILDGPIPPLLAPPFESAGAVSSAAARAATLIILDCRTAPERQMSAKLLGNRGSRRPAGERRPPRPRRSLNQAILLTS